MVQATETWKRAIDGGQLISCFLMWPKRLIVYINCDLVGNLALPDLEMNVYAKYITLRYNAIID